MSVMSDGGCHGRPYGGGDSMFGKKKYCLDLMERNNSGRLRLSRRWYFSDDGEGRKEVRFAKRHGLKAFMKAVKGESDLDDGQYLITFFREKRKRNGAIKSKKKLDGYEFAVE